MQQSDIKRAKAKAKSILCDWPMASTVSQLIDYIERLEAENERLHKNVDAMLDRDAMLYRKGLIGPGPKWATE